MSLAVIEKFMELGFQPVDILLIPYSLNFKSAFGNYTPSTPLYIIVNLS